MIPKLSGTKLTPLDDLQHIVAIVEPQPTLFQYCPCAVGFSDGTCATGTWPELLHSRIVSTVVITGAATAGRATVHEGVALLWGLPTGSRTDLLSLPFYSLPTSSPTFCCYSNSWIQCLMWNHIVGYELNHSSTSRSLSSVRTGCIRLVASRPGSSQAAREAAAFIGRILVSQFVCGAALPTRRYTATCQHRWES